MIKSLHVVIGLPIGLVLVLSGCGSTAQVPVSPVPHASNPSLPPINQPTLMPSPQSEHAIMVALPSWARAYDFESLVAESDLIVEGAVAGVQDVRLVSSAIFTDYEINVSKVLKSYPGYGSELVVIVHSGGTYQGVTQIIEGDEPYQVGENVLLFLKDISTDPVHAPRGETKFLVLMPGGRFHVDGHGVLSSPTKDVAVADTYRGQDKAVLERDILTHLLPPSEYLRLAVQAADLIVEGKVAQIQETLLVSDEITPEEASQAAARGELPGEVYTVYAFTVDRALVDKIAQYAEYPHKPSKYTGKPVVDGQTIIVVEIGGTYNGITQRRTLVPFLQAGDHTILFLTGLSCSDGLPICSNAKQSAGQVLYLLSDANSRFWIGPDDHLITFTHHDIEGLYAGQKKDELIQAILAARDKFKAALDEQPSQPPAEQYPFPPPPIPTATP